MHIAGVHQHHSARRDLELRLLVHIRTAPCGDRTDGKMRVGMPGVADFAPIGDGPRFNERQRRVAPEARGFFRVFGGSVFHRCYSRQARAPVY
ncbi:hypothetical protein D3C78_1829810 [compost metagenome]